MKKLASYSAAYIRQLHLRLWAANRICDMLPRFAFGNIRPRIYRLAGLRIEPGVDIMGNLHLVSARHGFYRNLSIGEGALIGDHVTINLDAEVFVGRDVAVSPHVLIYTATHQIGPGSRRRVNEVLARPVRIERGCWIGLAAVILPGVTIGHGSVVAAGSVVSEDVPPNSYVEGNPARVVRELPWGDR